MVHKPKHKVHSFRGLLADGGQDEINLERQNVNLAYRIVKFELMPYNVSTTAAKECIAKIYREQQTSITETVDFSDTDLLGAGIFTDGNNPIYSNVIITFFDNVLFSRNIYVTHRDANGSESCNYYIELEEVPVGAATLMQLKLQVARKLNLQQD